MPFLKRSPWILHYDGSSCNGCDIEVVACLTPLYDVERLGVVNTGNPKHADIFLITGSVNEQNRQVIHNLYEQMPDPKVVVAVGICAASGGIFSDCYNILGGANKVIPVDVFVPGCAARPEAIIDGVIASLKVLEDKRARLAAMSSGKEAFTVEAAVVEDSAEILALQKLAYTNEAELYNDFSLSPLRQTLDELREDFGTMVFLKAVMNNKIIGSVRAFSVGDTCYIWRLVIHPLYEGLGIGKRLMDEIENRFPCRRFEVFTGAKTKRKIFFFQKTGYKIFASEKVSEKRDRVYLEKIRKAEANV
jgi:ech hydrogenase subunit C